MLKNKGLSGPKRGLPGCRDLSDCTLLKKSRSKCLFRCPACLNSSGRSYLVKVYFYPGLFQPLKYLFRRSKASRELCLAESVKESGIPTVVPEKTRDTRKWGFPESSTLFFRELPDCINLEELLLEKKLPDLKLKRKVIEEYGRLARLIHDSGFFQDDFDPNNMLYQEKNDGSFRLYFVDFERTKKAGKIGSRKRVHSLAKLNRMGGRLSKTCRMRFLKAYLGDGSSGQEIRSWVYSIKEEEKKVFARDLKRAGRECTRAGGRIGRINYSGYSGYYRKKHHDREYYTSADIISLINAIEDMFERESSSEKQQQESSEWITVDLDGREETFHIRCFEGRGIKHLLQGLFKKTPLLEAWKTDNGWLKNRRTEFFPAAALEKKAPANRFPGFLVRRY